MNDWCKFWYNYSCKSRTSHKNDCMSCASWLQKRIQRWCKSCTLVWGATEVQQWKFSDTWSSGSSTLVRMSALPTYTNWSWKCVLLQWATELLTHIEEMTEVVLQQSVLCVVDVYRQVLFGISVDTDENRCYRQAAYWQFTIWCHSRLGCRVHRVIPSCCDCHIRDQYPDALGQYTGFIPEWRAANQY